MVALKIKTITTFHPVLKNLSHASFCVYLFHRVLFRLLLEIHCPKSEIITICYLIVFGLPLTYIVSKKVQSFYDGLLEKNRLAKVHFVSSGGIF